MIDDFIAAVGVHARHFYNSLSTTTSARPRNCSMPSPRDVCSRLHQAGRQHGPHDPPGSEPYEQCQRQPDIPAVQDHQHLASARVALRSADRHAVALDLHGVLQALLAACVSAIAGRPLHRRLATRLPRHMRRSTKALIFTLLVTVMAPLMFASGTLLTEASALLAQIAATARRGLRLRSGWSALQ